VEIDPRHGHQPAHLRGLGGGLCECAVDLGELLVEEVDLAQAARDRVALVGRQLERLEEAPALLAR